MILLKQKKDYKSKEVLKTYAELWNGIKNLIEKIENSPVEY